MSNLFTAVSHSNGVLEEHESGTDIHCSQDYYATHLSKSRRARDIFQYSASPIQSAPSSSNPVSCRRSLLMPPLGLRLTPGPTIAHTGRDFLWHPSPCMVHSLLICTFLKPGAPLSQPGGLQKDLKKERNVLH